MGMNMWRRGGGTWSEKGLVADKIDMVESIDWK
jgi:hypothetical protein